MSRITGSQGLLKSLENSQFPPGTPAKVQQNKLQAPPTENTARLSPTQQPENVASPQYARDHFTSQSDAPLRAQPPQAQPSTASSFPELPAPTGGQHPTLGGFSAGQAHIAHPFVPSKKPDTSDSKRKDLLHKQLLSQTKKAKKSPDGKAAHNTFKKLDALLKKHDYTKAAELLKNQLESGSLEANLSLTKGLGSVSLHATKTLQKQLSFVSKMEKKGVKVSLPPTEFQLQEYFSTFKKDATTRKGALQAFGEYTQAFHVHSAHVGGSADIKYSKDRAVKVISNKLYMPGEKTPRPQQGDSKVSTAVPDTFAEVTKKRSLSRLAQGENAGKYANDCEGFAYLAEKLLSPAGFEVKHVVASGNSLDHVMSAVTDPGTGQQVVASNGKLYDHEAELLKKTQGSGGMEAKKQLRSLRHLAPNERLKKSLSLAIKALSGSEGGQQLDGNYYIADTIQKAEIFSLIKDPTKRL